MSTPVMVFMGDGYKDAGHQIAVHSVKISTYAWNAQTGLVAAVTHDGDEMIATTMGYSRGEDFIQPKHADNFNLYMCLCLLVVAVIIFMIHSFKNRGIQTYDGCDGATAMQLLQQQQNINLHL